MITLLLIQKTDKYVIYFMYNMNHTFNTSENAKSEKNTTAILEEWCSVSVEMIFQSCRVTGTLHKLDENENDFIF